MRWVWKRPWAYCSTRFFSDRGHPARQLLEHVTQRSLAWTAVDAPGFPEFFDGFTSHRSDQYALAVTYCQLRGGQLPYSGTDVTVTAGHLLGTPDLEALPEAERPILARALAKRPEQRFATVRALAAALRCDARQASMNAMVCAPSSMRG